MSKPKGSPRKFSEKIALLNKKEAEANAEFEKIIKEVEATTRASFSYPSRASSISSWIDERHTVEEQPTQLDNYTTNNYGMAQHNEVLHVHQQTHNRSQSQNQHLHPPQDQMSIQTPVGVPNIEIFPINDDDNYQQQVTTSYRNDCSNPISSARSLPDIANLRVSNSISNMAPSYSDQRIPTNYDYNYDANCNIVTDNSAQNYYSQGLNNHQPQMQETTIWQMNDYNNLSQQSSQPQTLHQEYYQQQSQTQGSGIIRANSTSAVSNSWHNSNTLNAPTMIDNNLSKSSQGCYGYLEDQSASSNYCGIGLNNQEQETVTNPMMRSRSCNNIEQVVYLDDNRRNSTQQSFVENQQTCQFYH